MDENANQYRNRRSTATLAALMPFALVEASFGVTSIRPQVFPITEISATENWNNQKHPVKAVYFIECGISLQVKQGRALDLRTLVSSLRARPSAPFFVMDEAVDHLARALFWRWGLQLASQPAETQTSP